MRRLIVGISDQDLNKLTQRVGFSTLQEDRRAAQREDMDGVQAWERLDVLFYAAVLRGIAQLRSF